MLKSLLEKYIHLFKIELLNSHRKLEDQKLMPKLRSKVHSLEKRTIENEIDFINLIEARRYYIEAKKREILSDEEIKWCEKVLHGKKESKKPVSEVTEESSSELSRVLKERRSVRDWKKSKLEKKFFNELIEAAKWAPSSCNRQPWHFIVTRDKNKINILYNIKGQKFLKDAPNIILVLVNKNAWSNEKSYEYFSRLDAGAAIENLLLKAEDLGIGACWVNWMPKSVSKEQKERIHKEFNIPNHLEIISIIPIGKIKEKPSPPGRKDTTDILDFEKYTQNNDR